MLSVIDMLPFDTISLFFFAAIVLALTPGPDNLFVLAQSATGGRIAGFATTLGLCCGLLFHTAAVALGVAAIFAASEIAFVSLKVIGASYLIYLAWKTFRSDTDEASALNVTQRSIGSLFLRGIVMNVTNPKVALFFLALMPQFTDHSSGQVGVQIMTLGGVFMLATLLVFGAIAHAAGILGEWLQRSHSARLYLNRAAGVIFIALAARLLMIQH